MSDKHTGRGHNIGKESDTELLLRKRRIINLRYKVYIFLLGVFLFGFWPTFLSPIETVRGTDAFKLSIMDPIDGALYNRGEGGLLADIEDKEEQIEGIEEELQKLQNQRKVVENLSKEEKQNTIIRCLNEGECESIEPELMPLMDLLRVYIIVDSLQSEKMVFDQKQVLRNLHEYVTDFGRNGTITSIQFSRPVVADDTFDLNKITIDLMVEFQEDTKEKILTLLDNFENKVFTRLRVMYVVESMNYIISEYNDAQNVSMKLTAYYFDGGEEAADDE